MPVVDYELAWLRLKAHVDGKNSHGTSQLLRDMARIEVACELPEAEQGFDPRPLSLTSTHGDPRDLVEQSAVSPR